MNNFYYYTLDGNFIVKRDSWYIFENFTGIIKTPDTSSYWFKNGLLHRKDGPAVEYPLGKYPKINQFYWYLNGKEIKEVSTPESFKMLIDIMKLKELL